MEQHYGQIVEYIVRRNGYSITDLAAALNVNRRSIYNYFQNKYLKYDVIYKIGLIVRHDFSKEFPDLFTSEQFDIKNKQSQKAGPVNEEDGNDVYWQDKYIQLLELYNDELRSRLHSVDLNDRLFAS